jgi:hypothetical protein
MISSRKLLTTAFFAMPLLFLDTATAVQRQYKPQEHRVKAQIRHETVEGRHKHHDSCSSSKSKSSSKCCKKGPKGDRGRRGRQGPQGETGFISNTADFFALVPPDNTTLGVPTLIPSGGAIQFPQNGPNVGTGIVRFDPSSFTLVTPGTYFVQFTVSVEQAAQLVVALDTGLGPVELPYTVVGRDEDGTQIVGVSLVTTTVPNTRLSIRNPTLGSSPISLTLFAGDASASPVSAHLVIMRVA